MRGLILALVLAVWGSAAWAASSPVRVDVAGRMDGKKIELAAVNGEGMMKGKPPHWVKEGEPVCDLIFVGGRIGDDWKEYTFSFTAAASGDVELRLGAEWAKEAAGRGWVDVTGLSVDGAPVKNADMAEAAEDKKGVLMPKGFWIGGKARYVPGGGIDGGGAVRLNHDNRMHRRLTVAAGKTYTVGFKAKAAVPPEE